MAREDDSISRKEVLQMIDNIREAGGFIGFNTYSEAFDQVNNMSSVPRWPDNATNGDVIKALFAEYRVVDTLDGFIRIIDPIYNLATKGRLKKDWWNAPYKENKE